jgi:hypothetical protein
VNPLDAVAKSSELGMSPEVYQSRLDHFAEWQGLRDLAEKYGMVR